MCILIAVHNDCGHTTYFTKETMRLCHLGLHNMPRRVGRMFLSREVCDECWVLVPKARRLQGAGSEKGEGMVPLSEKKIKDIERWREGVEVERGDGGTHVAAGWVLRIWIGWTLGPVW
ncbi:unnamed protein product [Tuber aestivum]|uniref:Uncharacterized protein n=1 Tax=Tuber aestivum TaxID=59557 RepID=A0A292QA74_9PEZI|nr:unnamed protein product [Tuber aestivum]